jgi:hypothetical protein
MMGRQHQPRGMNSGQKSTSTETDRRILSSIVSKYYTTTAPQVTEQQN